MPYDCCANVYIDYCTNGPLDHCTNIPIPLYQYTHTIVSMLCYCSVFTTPTLSSLTSKMWLLSRYGYIGTMVWVYWYNGLKAHWYNNLCTHWHNSRKAQALPGTSAGVPIMVYVCTGCYKLVSSIVIL